MPPPSFILEDFYTPLELKERYDALEKETLTFINRINADHGGCFKASPHYPNLFAAHLNIYTDVALFKFANPPKSVTYPDNLTEEELGRLNAVKRAAFIVNRISRFKPISIEPLSDKVPDTHAMLWNEALAIKWAFSNLGYELGFDKDKRPFIPTAEKVAELTKMLAFQTITEDAWVAIFQLYFDIGREHPIVHTPTKVT